MASPTVFARRIDLIASRIPGSTTQLVRKVALVVDQTVVFATPVDTGKARSNWLVQKGSPRRDVIPPYTPGAKLGIGERQNASQAIAQAQAELASLKSGEPVYISNNTPYIAILNTGHSAQAPANFVEIAILRGVEAVRASRIL